MANKKSGLPQATRPKPHPEVMKEYSLDQLKLKGTIKVSLGEIVALKALALRKGFKELADKLRVEEKKVLSKNR